LGRTWTEGAISEILTVMKIQVMVFWILTPCHFVAGQRISYHQDRVSKREKVTMLEKIT